MFYLVLSQGAQGASSVKLKEGGRESQVQGEQQMESYKTEEHLLQFGLTELKVRHTATITPFQFTIMHNVQNLTFGR